MGERANLHGQFVASERQDGLSFENSSAQALGPNFNVKTGLVDQLVNGRAERQLGQPSGAF
jgi:hypothetical protein